MLTVSVPFGCWSSLTIAGVFYRTGTVAGRQQANTHHWEAACTYCQVDVCAAEC